MMKCMCLARHCFRFPPLAVQANQPSLPFYAVFLLGQQKFTLLTLFHNPDCRHLAALYVRLCAENNIGATRPAQWKGTQKASHDAQYALSRNPTVQRRDAS